MSENTQENKVAKKILSNNDTLLVLDKKTQTIEMLKGIDKDGNLQKVLPKDKKQNEQLLRVDKHGDFFSNFFSNFYRQLKNPTNFNFFKVSEYDAVDTAKKLQKYIDHASPEERERLKDYEVLPQKYHNIKNKNTMENNSENQEYRFQAEQIDWKTMEKFGLTQEKLEKMNAMDSLLRGFKTNTLIPITMNLGTASSKMDVRLSLHTGDTGQVEIQLHGIRKEPNYNLKFLGHQFSDEDRKNLKESGNMGRIVDLVNPKTDEIIPSIISRDRLTNELIAYKAENIKVPDEIKGVKLTEHQKQILFEGKPLYLEGMTSKKGESFNATLQFNADKRYVEFIFNNHQTLQKTPQLTPQLTSSLDKEAPKVFRGKTLDDSQYEKFKAGQTIYLDGLIDIKGKPYQGYITFNKETSKIDFSFTHPNLLKEQAQPLNAPLKKSNEAPKSLKNNEDSPKERRVQKAKEPLNENLTKSKRHKM